MRITFLHCRSLHYRTDYIYEGMTTLNWWGNFRVGVGSQHLTYGRL